MAPPSAYLEVVRVRSHNIFFVPYIFHISDFFDSFDLGIRGRNEAFQPYIVLIDL